MLRSPLLAAVAASALVPMALTVASASHASVAGANGRIAFESSSNATGDHDVRAVAADGTGMVNLTPGTDHVDEMAPAYSPDGTRIILARQDWDATVSSADLYVMNSDGSGLAPVVASAAIEFDPSFSPDGSKIVYESNTDGDHEIFTADADGSHATQLTHNTLNDAMPVFSPDGAKIVWSQDSGVPGTDPTAHDQLWIMNSDGTGQTQLTSTASSYDDDPDFAPDGSRVVFSRWTPDGQGGSTSHLETVKPDGTGLVELTSGPAQDFEPVFSPDGTKIAFGSSPTRNGDKDVWVMNADGSGRVDVSKDATTDDFAPSWQRVAPPAPPPTQTPEPLPIEPGTGAIWLPPTIFSPGLAPLFPKTVYGDLEIRGIDVLQVVQPVAGAAMGSYDPATNGPRGFGECGAGVPSNYVATRTGLLGARSANYNLCTLVGDAHSTGYNGSPLDADKPTTVMVYADVRGTAPALPDQALQVKLWATRRGTPTRVGQVLAQTITQPHIATSPIVSLAERTGTGADGRPPAVAFAMPQAWQGVDVDLHASITFAPGTRLLNEVECTSTCTSNNSFTLGHVQSVHLEPIVIAPIELKTKGSPATPPNPEDRFAAGREVYPGGEGYLIGGYRGTLDVTTEDATTPTLTTGADGTKYYACGRYALGVPADGSVPTRDCRADLIFDRLKAWASSNPPRLQLGFAPFAVSVRSYDLLSAIGDTSAGGMTQTSPNLTSVTAAVGTPFALQIVRGVNRPLSSVAHELGHALGLPHAGQGCGGTGAKDPQAGEPWKPVDTDDQGHLQGVGFDVRATGADRFIPPTDYDLMSYCSSTSDTGDATGAAERAGGWISAYNWSHTFANLVAFGDRVTMRATPVTGSSRYVSGIIDGSRVEIGSVGVGAGPEPSAPSSAYEVRSLDANGHTLLQAGAVVSQTHIDGGPELTAFSGPVAPAAVTVQIVKDGVVVATRTASRPPSVTIAKLHRRISKDAVVHWSASDPDGDPLEVTVSYAPDGKHFLGIYVGPSTGSVRIPASQLVGGRQARFRVEVSDGFTTSAATSRVVRVTGAKPVVRILPSGSGAPLAVGQKVTLEAQATTAWGTPLPKKDVRWYAGSRLVGRGETVRVRLPAGRVRLRVVATAGGRSASAATRVHVVAPRVQLVQWDAPFAVTGTTVSVSVAANGPATLVIGHRSYRVGTATRTIKVRVPRTAGVHRIRFQLRGHGTTGGRASGFLIVAR